AFLRQGQPCPWSSHRRQRRALHVSKSQGARQGPPHKLRAAERQIPARSIPHSCEEARSGGKPTPVAPSSLRRKAHSDRAKPTLVVLSGGKPTPVAPPTLHLCKSYP